MNNDLISRSELKKALEEYKYCGFYDKLIEIIDNAPTVDTKELKPLVDKVVEILPELTNAIIKELPKMISGEIKCSECSFYKNTWNIIPRPHGEWIFERPNGKTYSDFVYCSECQKPNGFYLTNFCPNCGADMRKGEDND